MQIVLISTYDLGRQPFGLASPAAFLRRAGHDVCCVDVTRSPLTDAVLDSAALVAFFLPMHTATRLALPLVDRIRQMRPSAHLVAYGLYAPLNATLLRHRGIDTVLGPEFESDLLALAARLERPSDSGAALDAGPDTGSGLPRVPFIAPDRSGLPALTRYASLQLGDRRRIAGYTEATRGCKHRCRHCPIVPVYDGRFRAVPLDVVLADIRAQVSAGAEHITFGDPDFFNGPTHALAVVRAVAREFPGLSYDVTIKVEHLRRHMEALPVLVETGCMFVTSAVESFDDTVLEHLQKGHTFADFAFVVERCRRLGLPLSPTFVAFTPWTTLGGYIAMLREILRLDLVPAVAPIQYAIRLLLPERSLMLQLAAVRDVVTAFDGGSLTHLWRHSDPRVDALQRELEALVGARLAAPRGEMFARVWTVAHAAAAIAPPALEPLPSRASVPYLNEPWYC